MNQHAINNGGATVIFNWLRNQTKQAVLAGLADAAEVLAGQQAQAPTTDAEERLRLALLPPVETSEPPARRRKAE